MSKQPFVITFGSQFAQRPHPTVVAAHPDGFAELWADNEGAARHAAAHYTQGQWSDIYPRDGFDTRWFPRGRMMVWIEHDEQVAHQQRDHALYPTGFCSCGIDIDALVTPTLAGWLVHAHDAYIAFLARHGLARA